MTLALSTTLATRRLRPLVGEPPVVRVIPSTEWGTWQALLRRAFTQSAGRLYTRPNFFLDYVTHDPWFKPANLLGLYQEGRLVSTCQVFRRTLAIGGWRFRLRGLGNIGTDPRVQGRGLGSRLMQWVNDYPAGKSDLSILYAGTPGFYERRGWKPQVSRSLAIARVAVRGRAGQSGAQLRSMVTQDRPTVARIYSRFNSVQGIPHIVRSGRYWDEWIMRWKLRVYGLNAEVAVDGRGKPLGYVFHAMRGDSLIVEEYGAAAGMLERVVEAVLEKFRHCRRAAHLRFLCATPQLEQALTALRVAFVPVQGRHASGCLFLLNAALKPWRDRICLWHVDHF